MPDELMPYGETVAHSYGLPALGARIVEIPEGFTRVPPTVNGWYVLWLREITYGHYLPFVTCRLVDGEWYGLGTIKPGDVMGWKLLRKDRTP
jgi:hypothetical protein